LKRRSVGVRQGHFEFDLRELFGNLPILRSSRKKSAFIGVICGYEL
jgi:hypothetical protein